MGHIDDGVPLLGQAADDLVQDIHFVGGQGAGGFIQDEHAWVEGDGFGNFDQLLLGDAEPGHLFVQVDRDFELVERGFGNGPNRLAVDDRHPQQPLFWPAAQRDVFGDGQPGDQAHLLIDGADALVKGVACALDQTG